MAHTKAPNAAHNVAADKPAVALPGMVYRSYFLLIMILLSASVQGERYLMVVLVEPIRKELLLSDTAIAVVKDLAIAVVYVLAVIPLARIADRWSKRKIVAIAAGVWGAAIIVCGLAKSFFVLLIGRAGIGLGEGGFTPPSQSWIADLFPMKQRATALAIFLLGASAGMFLGPAIGGWAADTYGWRNTLIYACIPAFVLAPIVWFTLRDVPPGLADGVHDDPYNDLGFWGTIKQLLKIKTMPPLVIAAALNSLLTIGLVTWAPAFVERTHGMSAQEAGLQMGGALFFGSVIGHTLGGPLADILGLRDLRWYIWTMMLAGAAAAMIGYVLLSGPMEYVFPLLGLNMMIGGMSAAPLLAATATISPTRSRSTAVALLMVSIQVIGLGLGPTLIGLISDVLRPEFGEQSLGIAMKAALLVGIPSTMLAWYAATKCRADFAAVGVDLDASPVRGPVAH